MGSYANSGFSSDDAGAVTPSDTVNQARPFRGIYVGTTGNVAVVFRTGAVVTFSNVPAGAVLPVNGIRVNSTNTTASDMVALY